MVSRSHKLKYDFLRQLCLEVSENNLDWYRVTCDTFRAFKGSRRVQGVPYTGKTYYKGTNYVHTGKVKVPRVIQMTELNDKVRKRCREEARAEKLLAKPNLKFLEQ